MKMQQAMPSVTWFPQISELGENLLQRAYRRDCPVPELIEGASRQIRDCLDRLPADEPEAGFLRKAIRKGLAEALDGILADKDLSNCIELSFTPALAMAAGACLGTVHAGLLSAAAA